MLHNVTQGSSVVAVPTTRSLEPRTGKTIALVGTTAVAAVTMSAWLTTVLGLPLMLGLACLIGILVGAAVIAGRRLVPITCLLFSVPIHLVHHFTYVPDHVGVSNGLAIEITDLWTLWLIVELGYRLYRGTARRVPAIFGTLAPVMLMIAADVMSLYSTNDFTLSLYGIATHLKAAALFVVLVATLTQGEAEIRAARLGLVLAVIAIGAICTAESFVGVNFLTNDKVDEMTTYGIFRAAGLETPTLTAGYLSALIPLLCIEVVSCRGFRKYLSVLSLTVGLVGLTCTLTRGAWGCLLLGSVPLFFYLYRRGLIRPLHVICIIGFGTLLQATLGDKIKLRVDEGGETLSERIGLLDTALNMASSSPLVGVGLNTYESRMFQAIPRHQTQEFVYLVHNEFALTVAETGPVGLLALIWLLSAGVARACRIARLEAGIGTGMLCALTITVLDMNVESYQTGPPLLAMWTLLAITTGVLCQQRCGCQRIP